MLSVQQAAAVKAGKMLVHIKKGISVTKPVKLHFYYVRHCGGRPNLEYNVQFWSWEWKTDVNKIEKVQQRATNMINVLENAGRVAERMMKWELFSLKERWLGGELAEIFKLPMGYYKIKLEGEFEIFWQTRIREAGLNTH